MAEQPITLDADLQEIANAHAWLGRLHKWCKWEHQVYDDLMTLAHTVQAQRELLRQYVPEHEREADHAAD